MIATCSIHSITSSAFISTLVDVDSGDFPSVTAGVTGGIYSSMNGGSFASGLVGGVSSEIVVGVMESGKGTNSQPLTKEQRESLNNKIKATTKLTAATAMLLAGGKEKDINMAVNVGNSAIENNYLGYHTKEDDEKAEKLSDEELEKQYQKLQEESGAVSWLLYNPYEVALEDQHHKRFGSGADTGIATQMNHGLTVVPGGGRIVGMLVEKATGVDLGISNQVAEPDLIGAKLGGVNKLKVTVKTPGTKIGSNDATKVVDKGKVGVGNKNNNGFGVNYKNFKITKWTAPNGTKQTYKVHQRNDIDWSLVRTKGSVEFRGKTNREAAKAGQAPELVGGSKVNLHHIGQNSKGPLVEVGELTHKKRHKILHQQHGVNKGHPEYPVDHGSKWQTDVANYWKSRIKDGK